VRKLGTKLQIAGVTILSGAIIELISPGFFSSVVQQLRIRSLLGSFRKQEQQEFDAKVEELVATTTPSPNQQMIPGGL